MKKAIFIASLATMLTACSNMTTIQKVENEDINTKQVPKWYLEHADTGTESDGWKFWKRNGYFYSVAEDVSPSMEMALKKATLKAKAKIIDRVNGEMNNRTTMAYNEQGGPENPIGRQQAEDVYVNLIAESVLRTYALEKKMIIYNPELRNYRAFVLMKITKADVDALAANYDQSKQIKLQNRVAGKTVDETAAELLEQVRK
jgi:hypothetical protein